MGCSKFPLPLGYCDLKSEISMWCWHISSVPSARDSEILTAVACCVVSEAPTACTWIHEMEGLNDGPTAAARSTARTVFARSNTEIVSSNPTAGMDVRVALPLGARCPCASE
jgi:hypothetical protein